MAYDLNLVKDYIGFSDGLVVKNPATGEEIASVKDWSISETEAAIERANVAFKSWSAKMAKERSGILRKWFELILENQEALAQLCTAECGKPVFESRGEVAYAASFIEWFAEEGKRLYGDVIPTHAAGKRILTLKQPIGVVAAITPWNFPLAMITRKVGPALAAGCTAVVKPAEATPLSAYALEALALQAGLPENVLQTITTNNAADVGSVFTSHPIIKKVSFTGSTAVGKLLMKQSADTVKKVSMELGGNAPFIVFDDADIDAAVAGAMVSKYRNAGQTCVCANRFYIHEDIHDEFVEKFQTAIENLKIGNGADDGVDIGPVINTAAVDKISSLVGSAKSDGANVVLGGEKHDAGDSYYAPTLITGVTMDMEIANSEIFGPVATIFKFKDEEEVIAMANDTPYGLACYFYSNDLGRVWRVAEGLEYGIVGINEGIISTEVAPFGGVKESGIGREGSKYGIDDYVEIKYCLMGGL
jgi:succinate-semialdehyde dehydrogenase / glutarate-semialdehyde dehydrogenase